MDLMTPRMFGSCHNVDYKSPVANYATVRPPRRRRSTPVSQLPLSQQPVFFWTSPALGPFHPAQLVIPDDDGDDNMSKTSKDSGSFCSMSDLPGFGYDRRPINPDFKTDTLRSKESGYSESEPDFELCNKTFSYSDCSALSDGAVVVRGGGARGHGRGERTERRRGGGGDGGGVRRKQKMPCAETCAHRCVDDASSSSAARCQTTTCGDCECVTCDAEAAVAPLTLKTSGAEEEEPTGERCTACGFTVCDDRVSLKGAIYHAVCFKCSRCV
ncbi:PREDICTED: uncharacterized protein LOC106807029 [Priapulus caudatus]|uniref:Uncharacterized protein LOC106807029 n=1 Tax=Priapulus caudatus TaxID=37621 RepID=A0ABM1DXP7_PRICU|nr:PREDICTED: uncharacterized protein LOC106807029 [Priapulus caudatus]